MKKLGVFGSITLLFLVLLGFSLLPYFLSSETGKTFLISKIESRTGAKVQIEVADFSWFKKQHITGFHFEKKDEVIFDFESLLMDASFWKVLWRYGSVNQIILIKPTLTLYPQKTFPKEVEGKHKKKALNKKSLFWSDFHGNLIIQDAALSILENQSQIMRIETVDFNLSLSRGCFPFSLRTQGKIRDTEFQGDFFAHGNVAKQKERIDAETFDSLIIEGKADFNHFPVKGLDALFSFVNPKLKRLLLAGLGERLSLNLDFSKNAFSLDLRSPLLNLNCQSSYDKGHIHLREPLNATWKIQPPIMKMFLSETPIASRGDLLAMIKVNELSILFKDLKFDYRHLAANANISLERGAFSLDNETLLLDQFTSVFSTQDLHRKLDFIFQNVFRFGPLPQTSIQGSGNLVDLKRMSNFDFFAKNFPSKILDQLTKNNMQQWIGSNFDLTAKYLQKDHQEELILTASSPKLTMDAAHFLKDKTFILQNPLTFSYLIGDEFISDLKKPTLMNGTFESLEIQPKHWKHSHTKLTLQGSDINLQTELGFLNLPVLNLKAEGHLADLKTEANTTLDFAPNTWGYSFLGSQVKMQALGRIKIKNEFEVSPLTVNLNGNKIQTTIEGKIKDQTFILKDPFNVQVMLEPELINPLLSKEPDFPSLGDKSIIQLHVMPGKFPLSRSKNYDMKIKGVIPALKLLAPETKDSLVFQNVQFESNFKSEMNHFELNANAENGQITLDLKGKELMNPDQIHLHFQNLSTHIADSLLQMNRSLPSLLGPVLNFNYQIEKKLDSKEVDLSLESQFLNLEGSFRINDLLELKSNRKPLKIEWRMNHESYHTLLRLKNKSEVELPFTIQNLATVNLDVAPLSLPVNSANRFLPKINFNLSQAVLNADVRIPTLLIKQKQINTPVELDHFNFNLQKDSIKGPITFKTRGTILSKDTKSGQINGEGRFENFFAESGAINSENLSLLLHMKLQHVPTVFIDVLDHTLKRSGIPPSAILGDEVNGVFDINVEKNHGTIKGDLNASACRVKLRSAIDQGILYLKEPLQASMTITPELNRILAQSANITITSMKSPIMLLIEPKGFKIPLNHLELRETSFSDGKLDLGQMTCQNKGNPSDIGGIFKLETAASKISLWFAPMEFQMRQGLLYLDRTEILYNHAYQMALWGDIDFNRRYVDMILGLTSQSLKVALGISDLPTNYVLKVPVTGPFGDIKVDKGAAATKIALLIGKKLAPQTGIWGNVLGAIGQLADDQSTVPPAKPPFPWHNMTNMQEESGLKIPQ